MINFKALFVGTGLIIFLGLLFQLIFLLAATAYTILINEHSEWQMIGQLLAYIFGIAGYFMIMSSCAYITATIAEKNIYLHAFLIAIFTTGISLVTSLREDAVTLNGILFVIVGILFSIIGGHIWVKHQTDNTHSLKG